MIGQFLVKRLLPLVLVLMTAACAIHPESGPPPGTEAEVAQLARDIRMLGPDVDPEEAERAARIAYNYTHRLALRYEITDPPLIHNMKVNQGIKPRGLCWHWAEDIQNRLNAEGFTTLQIHRAIANADNPILIDHSTSIISQRGDSMYDGIVVDPWRFGGVLYAGRVTEDDRYDWVPQAEVHAQKRADLVARGMLPAPG